MSDLDGKVILLTGATEGIGKAAALELARRGARLTLAGRDPEKTARVRDEVARAAGSDRIDFLIADLGSLAGVRGLAADFRARRDRLDVLANNAGAVFQRHRLTADGFEQTFALNHLGYFLLTRELLELLARTPGARIVNTASGAHRQGHVDLDTIATSRRLGFRAYCDSKLCNVLFTRELARRIAPRGVVANCFHPGFVRTGFGKNDGGVFAIGVRVAGLFGRTPEKGAESLVWLAASPEAAKLNGEYVHDLRIARPSSAGRDDELAKRLWELSERLCGEKS